jgi:hypothetical protein
MAGKYTLEQFEADKQAREEREARAEEARRERAEKGAAKAAWLRDGGSARDFEREWPTLRDEARKKRVMDADSRARERQRHTGVSKI